MQVRLKNSIIKMVFRINHTSLILVITNFVITKKIKGKATVQGCEHPRREIGMWTRRINV